MLVCLTTMDSHLNADREFQDLSLLDCIRARMAGHPLSANALVDRDGLGHMDHLHRRDASDPDAHQRSQIESSHYSLLGSDHHVEYYRHM